MDIPAEVLFILQMLADTLFSPTSRIVDGKIVMVLNRFRYTCASIRHMTCIWKNYIVRSNKILGKRRFIADRKVHSKLLKDTVPHFLE